MSKQIKKLIIENFLNQCCDSVEEQERIKTKIETYVENDPVDEITQSGFHKVEDHINLYAEDYRGNTWEEMCNICGVSSEVTEMMIPFAKALVKPKLLKRPFRITYRIEVYVDAENEEEAKEKFENIDLTEPNTGFIEIVRVEESE